MVKTGIGGRKLNKAGTPRRAKSQANKWNKDEGYDKYKTREEKDNIPGRQKALEWEGENTVYGLEDIH